MPGTFTVDTRRTFAIVILMGSGPKIEYQSAAQAVSAAGELKWEAQVAATWLAEPGRKPVTEAFTVTITGPPADPAAQIPQGSPIELLGLRVGVSSPEKTDRGGVRGGKAWYSAEGLRATNGHPASGKAEG